MKYMEVRKMFRNLIVKDLRYEYVLLGPIDCRCLPDLNCVLFLKRLLKKIYHGINYHVNLSILHFSQLFQDENDVILS
jgi:hypothetical protein